jgi:hypothetical protein
MTKDNNLTENESEEEVPDEDVKEIMEAYDLDKDEAEELQELMDETGLDIEEAHELWQEL